MQSGFGNAATLRPSPASTNVAQDAASLSGSSLMAAKPALASLMFGPSSKFNQHGSVEPDPGTY